MRLLNSATFRFRDFEGENIPPYAILSHTWGSEEISFQEMKDEFGTLEAGYQNHIAAIDERVDSLQDRRDGTRYNSRSQTTSPVFFDRLGRRRTYQRDESGSLKAGYEKIKRCGEMAAEHGLGYFWVDTCCIDKSSSAELSEAINSMYRWYKNADVCYAYLSDVPISSISSPADLSVFKSSRWFKRGWTLQELLAPANVIFLSKAWHRIGTKKSLIRHIRETTRIGIRALEGAELRSFSVAQRMSWAANRKTTRVEDVAYSLTGIFEINMPLLYGEREKAFLRLQEEVIKTSTDHSLFAWKDPAVATGAYTGLLAQSPDCFEGSQRASPMGILGKNGEFSYGNKGISVELFLIPHLGEQGIYRASLDCYIEGSLTLSPAIWLKLHTTEDVNGLLPDGQHFSRIHAGEVDFLDASDKASGAYRRVYVRQNESYPYPESRDLSRFKLFQLDTSFSQEDPIRVFPPGQWDPQRKLFHSTEQIGKLGALLYKYGVVRYLLIIGISAPDTPWCHVQRITSESPDLTWADYEPSGNEGHEAVEDYDWPETDDPARPPKQMRLNWSVGSLKVIYRTPVFTIRFRHEERPRVAGGQQMYLSGDYQQESYGGNGTQQERQANSPYHQQSNSEPSMQQAYRNPYQQEGYQDEYGNNPYLQRGNGDDQTLRSDNGLYYPASLFAQGASRNQYSDPIQDQGSRIQGGFGPVDGWG